MGLHLVSAGRNVPNEINVIIEIPKDAEPVKYEVEKESGAIFVDRILSTPMRYPCNYGYVPGTLGGDGDPLDALVILPLPLIPGSVIRCHPVGMLKMTDEAGSDEKLIVIPSPEDIPWLRAYQRHEGRLARTGWSVSATSSSTTRIWRRANGSRWKVGSVPTRPRPRSPAGIARYKASHA